MTSLFTIMATILGVALFLRLSGNPMGHPAGFLRRRILNWVPVGLTYALLYMGRYNLTVAKNAFGNAMSKADFGIIFGWGTFIYAFAFIVNGPLTDRIGGRRALLIAAIGAAAANGLLGWVTLAHPAGRLVAWFVLFYMLNMYFQSFGAVSIVKINSAWFHVRERGVFGGLFGILISAGIFLAYQVGQAIVDGLHTSFDAAGHRVISPPYWVFFIPAGLLVLSAALDLLLVKDDPRAAGHPAFDLGDASSGTGDSPDPVITTLRRVVTNPIILTIAAIELCTGAVRQGVMQWYIIFSNERGYLHDFFISRNWGLVLFLAGSLGGMTSGWLSDRVFGSRRGPVAALFYAVVLASLLVMNGAVGSRWALGICAVMISYCVIGIHGVLSGTATMDFGGSKNAATTVGLIDGCVYLGTSIQSLGLGFLTEKSWAYWAPFLTPFALIGLSLAFRIRGALPKRAGPAG